MKTAMRSVIWGTVAAAVALAGPSHAQSLEDIPVEQRLQILAGNQQARPLMEVFGIATFAAGADESCQLFDVGELRAFQVLKGQIGRQLARVGGDEVVAAIDQSERGTRQAKGCAMPDETKVTIERARVVARALQDAPAAMTTNQQQCAVEGTHWRFHSARMGVRSERAFRRVRRPSARGDVSGIADEFREYRGSGLRVGKADGYVDSCFRETPPDGRSQQLCGSRRDGLYFARIVRTYSHLSTSRPMAVAAFVDRGRVYNRTRLLSHGSQGRCEDGLCEAFQPGSFRRRGAHVLYHWGKVDRGYQPEHRSG